MTRLSVILAAFYLAGCASVPVKLTVSAPAEWTSSNPADRYGWSSVRACYSTYCRKSAGFIRVGVQF